jgi:hypothetical protein
MAKDTKPDSSGIMTAVKTEKDPDGDTKSDTLAVGSIQGKMKLADIVLLPPESLADLQDISFVHKHQFFSLKVAGVISGVAGVTLQLGRSHELFILADGSVTFDGENVDLDEARRLNEAAEKRRLQVINGEEGLPENRMLAHRYSSSGSASSSSSTSCSEQMVSSGGCYKKYRTCGTSKTVLYSTPRGCSFR